MALRRRLALCAALCAGVTGGCDDAPEPQPDPVDDLGELTPRWVLDSPLLDWRVSSAALLERPSEDAVYLVLGFYGLAGQAPSVRLVARGSLSDPRRPAALDPLDLALAEDAFAPLLFVADVDRDGDDDLLIRAAGDRDAARVPHERVRVATDLDAPVRLVVDLADRSIHSSSPPYFVEFIPMVDEDHDLLAIVSTYTSIAGGFSYAITRSWLGERTTPCQDVECLVRLRGETTTAMHMGGARALPDGGVEVTFRRGQPTGGLHSPLEYHVRRMDCAVGASSASCGDAGDLAVVRRDLGYTGLLSSPDGSRLVLAYELEWPATQIDVVLPDGRVRRSDPHGVFGGDIYVTSGPSGATLVHAVFGPTNAPREAARISRLSIRADGSLRRGDYRVATVPPDPIWRPAATRRARRRPAFVLLSADTSVDRTQVLELVP